MSTPTPFLFPGMPSIGFSSQRGTATAVFSVVLCKTAYFLWMALGARQVLLHLCQACGRYARRLKSQVMGDFVSCLEKLEIRGKTIKGGESSAGLACKTFHWPLLHPEDPQTPRTE